MRIKPKSVKATVTLLRDPSPVAMALVDQGACQTPFNVVKRDNVSTKKGTTMAKKLRLKKGKGASSDTVITKMQFSKAQFEDEDSVTKYLTDKGVQGFGDIEDGDDVWVLPSDDDFEDVKITKAKATPGLDDGVTVFIAAKVKDEDDEDEDEDEEDELDTDDEDEDEEDDDAGTSQKRGSKAKKVKPVKKAAKKVKAKKSDDTPVAPLLMGELAQKYDWWQGYMSHEKTLLDVVKDAMSYDALPPGMEEVSQALATATGNILSDDDLDSDAKKAALSQVGSEFATVTFDLSQIFDRAATDVEKHIDKDMRTSASKFMENFSDDVTAARKGMLFVPETIDDEDDDDDDGDDKDDTKAKKGAKKAKTPAAKSDDDKDNPILKTLKRLVGKIDAIEETQKSHAELFSRQQTKKSMTSSLEDLVDLEDEEDEDEAEYNARKSDMRAAFGLREPRSGASAE